MAMMSFHQAEMNHFIGNNNRPVKGGFGRFGRTALTKKVHLLRQKVHCYNYTIQERRNWPSSCQAKISPTIKSSCD